VTLFWNLRAGWFEGMSTAFLAVHAPKVLVLAGADRLDTPLTIAHMQGKFQLNMLPSCGHSIMVRSAQSLRPSHVIYASRVPITCCIGCAQEDDPKNFAQIVLSFLQRYSLIARSPHPCRVGDAESLCP